MSITFNSFLASAIFCCLLLTFANSLDPDQHWRSVGPELNPNSLTLTVNLKDFFEKSADENKSMKNYPACKELNCDSESCYMAFYHTSLVMFVSYFLVKYSR